MNELGFYLLGTLLRGAVIFTLILSLEKLFRHRFTGKNFRHWWAGAVLLMLLPLNPGRVELPQKFTVATVSSKAAPSAPQARKTAKRVEVATLFTLLAMTGAGVVLARRLWQWRKFRRYLAGCPELDDPRLKRLLPGKVRLFDGASPLCFGLFRPGILFPARLAGQLDDRELAMLLRHEWQHIRRHDQYWNWLFFFAGALFWFNPFFRFCAGRLLQSREMACDARVVKEFSREEKIRYAQLICDFASAPSPVITPCLGRDAREIKQRIEEIAMTRKPSPARRLLTVFLLAAVAAAAFLVPGCARLPEADRTAKVELTVDTLPNPDEPEKPYLRFFCRIYEGDKILASPRVIAHENQMASVTMVKEYDPPERFREELTTQNFGTQIIQGAGIWSFLEGRLVGDEKVEVKFALVLREFKSPDQPTAKRFTELKTTIKLGQTIAFPL